MSDYEVLRAVLRFVSGTLEIAEAFLDAPTVCVLTQIIEIIEEGGHTDSYLSAVSNG